MMMRADCSLGPATSRRALGVRTNWKVMKLYRKSELFFVGWHRAGPDDPLDDWRGLALELAELATVGLRVLAFPDVVRRVRWFRGSSLADVRSSGSRRAAHRSRR